MMALLHLLSSIQETVREVLRLILLQLLLNCFKIVDTHYRMVSKEGEFAHQILAFS